MLDDRSNNLMTLSISDYFSLFFFRYITMEELEQALKEKGLYDEKEIKDIISEADVDNVSRKRPCNSMNQHITRELL